MKKIRIKKLLPVIAVLLIISAGIIFLNRWENSSEGLYSAEISTDDKKNIETVLFIGLDKYQASDDVVGYLNDQQSDFLMLMVLNHDEKTCRLLHINRDTMTEIHRLGVGGSEAGSFVGQLALAHTFGSGGSDSCINTTKAVSEFLEGLKIDHYIAFTMEAVPLLNDMLGGVEVKLEDDFSSFDPEMTKDSEICLKGDQALIYVRARKNLENDTNLNRMKRQRQYVNNFYEKLSKRVTEEPDFLEDMLIKLNTHFRSDYTINQLSEKTDVFMDYKIYPIYVIEGEAQKGEKFMEFYADEHSVTETIKQILQ